jgi:hypothetical protein
MNSKDPISIIPPATQMKVTSLVSELIEADAEIDSVRIIATRVCPRTNQVQVINHVWGNRLLADTTLDLLNDREVAKYDFDPEADDAEGE